MEKQQASPLEEFLAAAAAQQQPQQSAAGRDTLAAILAKLQKQEDLTVRGPVASIGIRG